MGISFLQYTFANNPECVKEIEEIKSLLILNQTSTNPANRRVFILRSRQMAQVGEIVYQVQMDVEQLLTSQRQLEQRLNRMDSSF